MKTKQCSKCKNNFPATGKFFHKDKNRLDGFQCWCRKCVSIVHKKWYAKPENKIHIKEYHKEYHKKYRLRPEFQNRIQNNHLKHNYNITLEQKMKKYCEQNGCCGICGQPISFNKIQVDHNHKTNKNRGLLCIDCNLGFGRFKENPIILRNAIIYLEKYA